jgi:putative protease
MELLAPAGSPQALDAAIDAGADAVYLGLKSFNARLRSANFAYSQFEALVRTLHKRNRKVYVTVNTVFEEREADRMYQLLKYLAAIGPDALIVQDFGVIEMARRFFPSLKLHASTQMNIACARGAHFLSKHGVSRMVAARELTFDELKAIRGQTNMELEIFAHGALCISVSGLCLFSSYLGGKSANRGMCTQACRRLYRTGASPDEPDERGYFFSPRDLQLIDKVPLLYEAGINALKIEGRMKSAEYTGTVTGAYRTVLDACGKSEDAVREAVREAQAMLRGDYARAKTRFHFDGHDGGAASYLDAGNDGGTGIRLGVIKKKRSAGESAAVFIVPLPSDGGALPPYADLAAGDSARFHRKDDSHRATHKIRFVEREGRGVWISAPEDFETGDTAYLIQRKAARRYPPLLPQNLAAFRKTPGRERAPEIELRVNAKKEASLFPPGLYVAVENAADLYVAQSVRTQAVILSFKEKNAAALIAGKQTLPYPPEKIIISMPAFYPESEAAYAEETLPRLAKKGYTRFVVNNPGQIAPLKSLGAAMIAGPYLYTFNRYSAAFLQNAGFSFFVSPLENARQNLEKTFAASARQTALRSGVFLTIYARPKLFQTGDDLSRRYDFTQFYDKEGGAFNLSGDGSRRGAMSYVSPQTPFSITDKIPFLKTAGWNRFILDFTPLPLKKVLYKQIMKAAAQERVIPCSRFNWKDGFYTDKPAAASGGLMEPRGFSKPHGVPFGPASGFHGAAGV